MSNGIRSSKWAGLPPELLDMIGNRLDSPVDVLSFRSVCTSWRSSILPPCFSLKTPPLLIKPPHSQNLSVSLTQSKVCRLEFVGENPYSSSSSSSSPSRGWLTKVTETEHGRLQLLHPLSNHHIRYFPIKLNLLDVRFVQLGKACSLKAPGSVWPCALGISKIVSFNKDDHSVLGIIEEGKLGYWKRGDESWTLLDDRNFQYDDIVELNGQFYVIDRWGTVSWIDPSLKVVQYAPPLFGCGDQKNLVESCGDLYVVDRYLDGERRTWREYENVIAAADNNENIHNPFRRLRRFRKSDPKAVDFRVYKLDEELATWVDVKSLGDRVFVLGVD